MKLRFSLKPIHCDCWINIISKINNNGILPIGISLHINNKTTDKNMFGAFRPSGISQGGLLWYEISLLI
jgi:hypothetical protein